MPSSDPSQIPTLLRLITASCASSILEIGPGFGKWGALMREYLDVSDGREAYGRETWRHRIDCIEANPAYVTALHAFVYNDVHIGDARTVVPRLATPKISVAGQSLCLRRYDLVLLIDVLEHFTEDDGRQLLDHCARLARGIIIATPLRLRRQGPAFGNDYETHRHGWTLGALRAFGPLHHVGHPASTIVYVGADARRVGWRERAARWPRILHAVQQFRTPSPSNAAAAVP